jgi:hypothetical protein
MRLIGIVLTCLYLCACAGPPQRPPLGQVLLITGAVILAGAIAEHHAANHLVHSPNGVTPTNDPCAAEARESGDAGSAPQVR